MDGMSWDLVGCYTKRSNYCGSKGSPSINYFYSYNTHKSVVSQWSIEYWLVMWTAHVEHLTPPSYLFSTRVTEWGGIKRVCHVNKLASDWILYCEIKQLITLYFKQWGLFEAIYHLSKIWGQRKPTLYCITWQVPMNLAFKLEFIWKWLSLYLDYVWQWFGKYSRIQVLKQYTIFQKSEGKESPLYTA